MPLWAAVNARDGKNPACAWMSERTVPLLNSI
jgi:hypothetical protein